MMHIIAINAIIHHDGHLGSAAAAATAAAAADATDATDAEAAAAEAADADAALYSEQASEQSHHQVMGYSIDDGGKYLTFQGSDIIIRTIWQ